MCPQALDAALQEVDSIFEDCATYGKIKSILNAGDYLTSLARL